MVTILTVFVKVWWRHFVQNHRILITFMTWHTVITCIILTGLSTLENSPFATFVMAFDVQFASAKILKQKPTIRHKTHSPIMSYIRFRRTCTFTVVIIINSKRIQVILLNGLYAFGIYVYFLPYEVHTV